MKTFLPVAFAIGTAFFWGVYGPMLSLSRGKEYSPFKPYVFVGLAYLVIGVGMGMIMMKARGDSFSFSGAHSKAAIWGFIAGAVGALGALSLTFAMFSGGTAMPQIIMPIVFGGAVTVNAITTLIQQKKEASPLLILGMVGMAICIILVASNTPHAAPPKPPGATDGGAASSGPGH